MKQLPAIKHFRLFAALFWSACVVLTWAMLSISIYHLHVDHTAIREARIFLDRARGIRFWAARHGGIYVPPSETTPPNPYLSHIPDRDLTLANGKRLTLMNPAYVLRDLQREFSTIFDIQTHLSSLNPIRPENSPDPWERQALQAFDTGETEAFIFTTVNGQPVLRLMEPLRTEKSCLKCHAQQGYKEGGIRGGISINIPLQVFMSEARQQKIYWGYALFGLWLLGLGGIWFSSHRIINLLRERDRAYAELALSQADLENKIRERTNSLAQSHSELEQIFNSAADGLRIVDWDYTIVKCNDTFAHMTAGKSASELTNRKCYDVFPGPFCHTEECPLAKARLGEEIIHEATKTCLDGRTIDCLTQSAIFYDSQGKAMGILESYRDITRLKELEKRLSEEASHNAQQAVALQQNNADIISQNIALEQALAELKTTQSQMLQNEKMATVGQLAAGVAHEINNPTGFVTSNLSTLEKYVQRLTDFVDQLQEAVAPEQKEAVASLRKKMKIDHISADIHDLITESLDGTERIKKIVMSLKNFSRADQDEYGQANITDCLESTLNVVWNELKYKATVEKEYAELPLTKCYAQQLNQVFMNLLVNAAQAIEEQGVITIKTWHDDDNIFIAIADTGSGMDEETMAHIFEPFYTTKGKDKGTGLGLSIAHDIITKKHLGRLCVESSKGKGTTFTIELPIVRD